MDVDRDERKIPKRRSVSPTQCLRLRFNDMSSQRTARVSADIDDFMIGDPGEAYGAYLTLDQPVSITVSEDLEGLDFNSNFAVSFPSQLVAGEPPARTMLQRLKARNLPR